MSWIEKSIAAYYDWLKESLAIINDTDREINTKYIEALQSKGADYMLWNKRHEPAFTQKLVA